MSEINTNKSKHPKIVGEIGPDGFKRFQAQSSTDPSNALTSDSAKRIKKKKSSNPQKKEYDLECDFLFHHLVTLGGFLLYQFILPFFILKQLLMLNFLNAIILGGLCFYAWAMTLALKTYGPVGPLLLRIALGVIGGFHSWTCLSMFKTQILLALNHLPLPINYQELQLRVIVTLFEWVAFLLISNYYENRKDFFH